MGIYDMNAFEELEWCDGIRDENMNINLDFWNQNQNMVMRRSALEKAFTYSKASWRDMLVVQPAAREIIVDAETSSMGGVSGGEARITVEGGVRMGMLFDYVWMVVAEPISGFGFDWRGVRGLKGDAEGDVDGGGDWGGGGHGEIFKYLGRGWRGRGSKGMGNWDGRVRLMTRHTRQCCPSDVDALMQRVVSEGYRNWDVKWKRIEVQEEHRPWGRTYIEGSGEWKVEEEKEEEGK
ncbi:hypothetical protein EAF04_010371 [Stromatinia cepivora]|nr:hypothetical protein EAF04_010371 [Stromatinia cepivora]